MNENIRPNNGLSLTNSGKPGKVTGGELLSAESIVRAADGEKSRNTLLTPTQLREIKNEQQRIIRQGAVDIATHQIGLVVEMRSQEARFNGEAEREVLKGEHNGICDSLADRAVRLGEQSIRELLASNQRQEQLIDDSKCTPSDKMMLREVLRQLAERRLENIEQQHLADN